MIRGIDTVDLMGDSDKKAKGNTISPEQFRNDEADLLINTQGFDRGYRLKWIVEKIGLIPAEQEIEGPAFTTHASEEWKISLKYNQLVFLYLHNRTNRTLNGVWEATLADLSGKVWFNGRGSYSIPPKSEKDILPSNQSLFKHFNENTDDSLIICCCLKTTTYILTTNSNRLPDIQAEQNYIRNFQNLFKTGHQADVIFKFGEEEVPAHKLILCTQSQYFNNMFQSGMTEQEEKTVTITDIDISVFKKILEFFYTGRVKGLDSDANQSFEELYDTYKAADKYQIIEFRQICGNILFSKVTEDNVLIILTWIVRHNDLNLKTRIFHFILNNFKNIRKSEDWNTFASKNAILSCEIMSYITDKFID